MSCSCYWCPECNGTGMIMVPCEGYPEEDLETCPRCDAGVLEQCDECALQDEIAEDWP
jgi:hypothetical protein